MEAIYMHQVDWTACVGKRMHLWLEAENDREALKIHNELWREVETAWEAISLVRKDDPAEQVAMILKPHGLRVDSALEITLQDVLCVCCVQGVQTWLGYYGIRETVTTAGAFLRQIREAAEQDITLRKPETLRPEYVIEILIWAALRQRRFINVTSLPRLPAWQTPAEEGADL